MLEAALVDTQRGLGAFRCEAAPGVLETIAGFSEGDLRRALNALEVVVQSLPLGAPLSPQALEAFALERHIRYDRNEDEHYDTASAFIKSIRGGDPDAALYWLAKMLAGGEDPRFIARRLVILASEDVGMADPRGLSLAMATFQACEAIGLPECGINLAHAVVFLATAPKSNTAYMAFQRAQAAIAKGPVQSVPLWLRSSKTAIAKELGYGVGYEYSHDFPEAVSGQDYQISPDIFYTPKPVGAEALVAERLMRWKALKAAIKGSSHNP